MTEYILALDQGTTSSRAILFDHDGNVVSVGQTEFTQHYPKSGWVEHDAMEIWGTQIGAAGEALAKAGATANDVAAIGITNQRETTVVWDAETGRPIYNAIVWQCRRTAAYCEELKSNGYEEIIKNKAGLVIDAYFSATKIRWILDNVSGARAAAENGKLRFGTVDSWLIWKLTGGAVHVTDYSNASRTMLFNIHTLDWDEELLRLMNIPRSMLPEVRSCGELYGYTTDEILGGAKIPIAGSLGDQHAAMFGQRCIQKGDVKNTYGTGCFMLMNTGNSPIVSKNGLLTTIAWERSGEIRYALEGSIFNAGAAIQWLRDELKLVYDAPQSEYYANLVKDTGGVYVVPAFTGLGAPYWDMYARGAILGITRGTKREHIVRATLEAIAYQVKDVLQAMEIDSGLELGVLKVDGGASNNNFLMQFQSDILGCRVVRPTVTETTALGAAFMAGLSIGYWNESDLETILVPDREFIPAMSAERAEELYCGWKKAVARSEQWED